MVEQVIPVTEQPEPDTFNKQVREPGQAWVRRKGLDPRAPVPRGTKLKPCWRECLDDLHSAYGGICAYLSIYIERVAGTVDHFVPKSVMLSLAYEWSNYRFAWGPMNTRKGAAEDVLDPFTLQSGMFQLELVSGRIYPNPKLPKEAGEAVARTIRRLSLDDSYCRDIRARRYLDYVEGEVTATYLASHSPFIHYEADRQGLL